MPDIRGEQIINRPRLSNQVKKTRLILIVRVSKKIFKKINEWYYSSLHATLILNMNESFIEKKVM